MENIAISGSWRYSLPKLFGDVENTVKKEIEKGNCIISGGAPGVDFVATEIVLKYGNPKNQLKIFLPTSLENLIKHYKKRINENILDEKIGKSVINQLEIIKQNFPKSIFDSTDFNICNPESYYARNTTIIENCDILYAFCVNNSKGTMDAYDKAKSLGKKVHLKKYSF